jgi:hypothetical protein
MSASVDIPIEILKQVSSLLRRLTSEDVENLLSGRARLVCEPVSRRASSKRIALAEVPDLEQVQSTLSSMDSREKGYSYLVDLGLGREQLRLLASSLDLPVPRSDTVDKVRDRIVEATIGYRLSSEAIRGGNTESVIDDIHPQ